jgi:hypothetical protein
MRGAPRLDPRLTPDPSTPAGGERRYVEDEIAVRNLATGAYTALTSAFRVKTPSVRLGVAVAVVYKPDATEDTTIPAGWTLDLVAWKRNKAGILMRGNPIVTGVALPYIHDGSTVADEIRGVIHAPNLPGTTTEAGVWYVVGTWEPATGHVIDDDELQRLFQLCHVQVDAGLLVSKTGA